MKRIVLTILLGAILSSGSIACDFVFGPYIALNIANVVAADQTSAEIYDPILRKSIGLAILFYPQMCEDIPISFRIAMLYSIFGKFYQYAHTDMFMSNAHLKSMNPDGLGNYYSNANNISYSYSERLRLRYLRVPLEVGYTFFDKLSISAGPNLGFLLSAKADIDDNGVTSESSSSDEINKFDFGGTLGLNYKLNHNIVVGVNYYRGFTDIFKNETAKNTVFSFSIGYYFSKESLSKILNIK